MSSALRPSDVEPLGSGAPAEAMRRVLLIGPPGSGKSSQARELASNLGIRHLSSGEMLREEVRRASPIGRRAATYMHAGELVPDWLVELLQERRLAEAIDSGFVLDGYPRNATQARRLMRAVGDRPIQMLVELVVPDEVVFDRLCRRFQCGQCGAITPSAEHPVCTECGGILRRRTDDNDEVVRARLARYHELLDPMLADLQSIPLHVVVDGDRSQEIVARDLLRVAGPRRPAPVGGGRPSLTS